MEHVRLDLETYVVLIAVFVVAFTVFMLYHAVIMHKPVLAYSEVKCLNTSECDLLAQMMVKNVGAMVDTFVLGLLFLIVVTAITVFIFNHKRQKRHMIH
ncbi:hypothetical protein [Thermofilum sp.]|uniref:hypothetical protein n=1 Tax=Thermofilum sp. TaxID=1961369 RepID=UPI0025836BF5|nr:hypothetical protein [Thermofilum sp.]